MAFRLSSFLGGVAKGATDLIEEREKENTLQIKDSIKNMYHNYAEYRKETEKKKEEIRETVGSLRSFKFADGALDEKELIALASDLPTAKSIAEELRGLAVEANVPIVSATQTTRSGYGSSDVELTDTSESFGLPATADLMFALISTEELEGLGQILVKQLKNRYNDLTIYKRFVVGIDRSKMRLYDVEQDAQNDILDAGKEKEYDNEEKKPKKSFEGFKF